jgi:hypothetical protein
MERHLCARPDDQPVILIPIAQGYVRFDVSLLHFGNQVFTLKNVIGFAKTLLNVSDIDPNFGW